MISESGQYFWVRCSDAVGGTGALLTVWGSLEPQLPLETREPGTDSQVTAGGQSPLCFLLTSHLLTRVCFPGPAGLSSAIQFFHSVKEPSCDKKLPVT